MFWGRDPNPGPPSRRGQVVALVIVVAILVTWLLTSVLR